ncbi:MAG: glutamate racemase [Chloroflexi bacterium]|nr:glutamate racemase [Chloroflexota bacterium]
MNTTVQPIGIFDSGVGGLTVLKRMREALPRENYIYFADLANVPYGDKSPGHIVKIVSGILDFMRHKNVKAIIMACNTSSALVLPGLLENGYPVPLFGMIEPIAEAAKNGLGSKRVGILANPVTVNSGIYQKMLAPLNSVAVPCPRLVPFVEKGIFEGEEVESALAEYLAPVEELNADTLILGCTHYPFLAPVIEKMLKNGTRVLDPSLYTVKQVKQTLHKLCLLRKMNNGNGGKGRVEFYTSKSPENFKSLAGLFLGEQVEDVKEVSELAAV